MATCPWMVDGNSSQCQLDHSLNIGLGFPRHPNIPGSNNRPCLVPTGQKLQKCDYLEFELDPSSPNVNLEINTTE
jgi:hypothetical protein